MEPTETVAWVVDQEATKPYWLEVQDPEGWYKAIVTSDGCIHLNRYLNIPLPEVEDEQQLEDYLHICDLDDMIARLQALKTMAQTHFGKEWPR
jgi:hypothetical protein